MASKTDKILNMVGDIGYKIGAVKADDSMMEEGLWLAKIGVEIGGTFAVVLLLFIAIVMMAQLTSKLNNAYMFGNRSQKMCGQNYMEKESARYKLYIEYTSPETEKKIKNIKKLLSVSLILIVSILIVSIGISWVGITEGNDWNWWRVYFVFAIVLLASFLIAFFVVNRKAVLENTYGDSKTEKKMTPLLVVMLILIVITCIVNSVFINDTIKDETPTLFVLMIAAIFTISFIFVININTKKINDNFISQYNNYSREINGAICKLGQNNKDAISGGVNDGMNINKWIKQMLSRNYNRINQDGEGANIAYGFGENIDCSDKKSNDIYSYIEHNNGKELYELPTNIDRVRQAQNTIQKNMWNMRYENNTMIKPVKKIIQQMRIFVLILMFILAFIVYHVAYVNYPAYTKLTLVAIVLIFTFVLMYSVII